MKDIRVLGACILGMVMATGCGPTHQLVPLRGEDPDSLMYAGDNVDWLKKSGATMAVEAFRTALAEEEYQACIGLLGPATLAILRSRAAAVDAGLEALLKKGSVEGLGLRGADDPVNVLRTPDTAKLRENRSFDPTRTKTTVLARFESRSDPVEIPAIFTTEGWRIELVRVVDTGTP
ncbi:MAG: hypothetical protein ISR64_08760 [Deltaproteobacteria bacterium]|nr:hypothetical protein [Deltaproteobacteria bacterium]